MKLKSSFLALFSLVFLFSCNDSTSDEFDDMNPDAVARYIETIALVSAQDSDENTTITINYDGNDRVSSITDGTESSLFVYDNGNLSNVTGSGDNLSVEELYQSPYDAFETGEVVNYDSNGNPQIIKFFEYEYEWQTDTETQVEYTAEIIYDSNPNPYFYTLQAAGIIDVMDDVDLNFSTNPTMPEIVQARLLFPLNNITGIKYRNEDGELINEISVDYVYNTDDYPTSASVTATEYEEYDGTVETYTDIFSLAYTYRSAN